MRLRSILFIAFCLSALAPLALFWLLPNVYLMDDERADAKERQLMIASSLSGDLESYHASLEQVFDFHLIGGVAATSASEQSRLLESLSMQSICIYGNMNGRIIADYFAPGFGCGEAITQDRIIEISAILGEVSRDKVTTHVGLRNNSEPVFQIVFQDERRTAVATVGTDYIRQAAARIRFGIRGHATVVDQSGRTIAHPFKSWELEAKSLIELDVVKSMLNGQTGVREFYSPALKENMVAGFTYVEGPGWGVMVPQPLSELESKLERQKSAGLTVLIFGVALAALFAYLAAKFLTNPIEQMIRSMHRIGAGELRAYEDIKENPLHPQEFAAAREGIKAMSMRLMENIDTISKHAYLDGITGLPNRECFRVLALEEIEKMHVNGMQCALLFLDLDGFKQVNDVYGHRSGDDLLKGFASKLHIYCGNVMKQSARGVDQTLRILPARLGGDEFVVLLSNLSQTDYVETFAKGIFSKVFGPFNIHNGISLNVSGSVGGALYPRQADNFDELLRLADIAMYEAKNNGKGRFCLYSKESDQYLKQEQDNSTRQAV